MADHSGCPDWAAHPLDDITYFNHSLLLRRCRHLCLTTNKLLHNLTQRDREMSVRVSSQAKCILESQSNLTLAGPSLRGLRGVFSARLRLYCKFNGFSTNILTHSGKDLPLLLTKECRKMRRAKNSSSWIKNLFIIFFFIFEFQKDGGNGGVDYISLVPGNKKSASDRCAI